MNKIALITGATSGIGKESALLFAQKGFDIIATGRRQERLTALEKEIKENYKVDILTLCFDVRNQEEVNNNLGSLPKKWQAIDVLLNNAGGAWGKEPIYDGDTKDWDQMIDTNVKGLLYVSKIIIPFMKERCKGHIFNICSIAGKETYAGGAVYCASKAAVNSISYGMRLDLNPFNIKVTNICPGAVETEFSIIRFKGNKAKADATYQGFTPLTGKDIAQTIVYCALLPEHVCIADLTIFPTAQASSGLFNRNSK
jgi:Short-chain alcohol dehydrogenase of unknown specificity